MSTMSRQYFTFTSTCTLAYLTSFVIVMYSNLPTPFFAVQPEAYKILEDIKYVRQLMDFQQKNNNIDAEIKIANLFNFPLEYKA